MRDTTREDELKQFVDALKKAIKQSAPIFNAAMQQMKMAADNLRISMQAFGTELNEAMEKWSQDGGDDGEKVGAKE